VLSYPVRDERVQRALSMLADALRRRRNQRATRWRKLTAGRQALLVVAYLRKGESYADLACGFSIGTSTVYRYVREAIMLLATMAPTLTDAIEVARGKAFVILDGTLLRIDGSAWPLVVIERSIRASTSVTA
jgi:Helix-turn-helix of DDE superfamily endonuclease